jgi:acetyl-CoA carboxylase carboxyl transferase subunit beta
MNWISNYVRPTINSIFSRREVPENLWQKCSECGTMLFHRELTENLNVCTQCDHHMAITARDRFQALFDGGVYLDVAVPEPLADPLGFKDQKRYPDRMKAAVKSTGEKEAMLVAEGEICAHLSLPPVRISRSWLAQWVCMWATQLSRRPNAP